MKATAPTPTQTLGLCLYKDEVSPSNDPAHEASPPPSHRVHRDWAHFTVTFSIPVAWRSPGPQSPLTACTLICTQLSHVLFNLHLPQSPTPEVLVLCFLEHIIHYHQNSLSSQLLLCLYPLTVTETWPSLRDTAHAALSSNAIALFSFPLNIQLTVLWQVNPHHSSKVFNVGNSH